MNSVQLIGRLTRDPEVRYTSASLAVATFNIAIDRTPKKDGTKETDFPRITVFGRQAESAGRCIKKGALVAISGRIQTGSYTNKNGDKVYTTDVIAERLEFLEPNRMHLEYTNEPTPIQNYSGGSGQPGTNAQMNPQTAQLNAAVKQINDTQGHHAAAEYMVKNGPWKSIDDDDIPF